MAYSFCEVVCLGISSWSFCTFFFIQKFKLLKLSCIFSVETKCDAEENLPSMETLDISKDKIIKSIPTYFGGEEEEDIPDMADYEEADNVIEADAVSCDHAYWSWWKFYTYA